MAKRPHQLDITESIDDDGRPLLLATGDIDLQTAPLLRTHLTEAGFAGQPVVVDLQHVRLIDSPGLGILIHCANILRERGGSLVLRGAHGTVRELFDMVRLDHVLTLE